MGPAFHTGGIYLYPGGKGVFNHLAGGQAFQLGSDKGWTFSGFYMLKLDNGVKIIIVFEA